MAEEICEKHELAIDLHTGGIIARTYSASHCEGVRAKSEWERGQKQQRES